MHKHFLSELIEIEILSQTIGFEQLELAENNQIHFISNQLYHY